VKILEINNSRNVEIVTDMDEVLVNISPKWARKAWPQVKKFINSGLSGRYENIERTFAVSEVLSREEYYISDFLKEFARSAALYGREDEVLDFINLHSQEIDEIVMSVYLEEDFYDDLLPTSMGKGIALMAEQHFVKKIHICSHVIPGTESSKERFLKRYFKSEKIKYNSLPIDQKKSEFVKTVPGYTAFIDDRPDIILDVVKETNSDFKEFIMPQLGYNNILRTSDVELQSMINERNAILKVYRNVV
jgi:hypothetical protein